MKSIILVLVFSLSSLMSNAWIDSVNWNKGVSPHTVKLSGSMVYGKQLKYYTQSFSNGSDTLILDLIFSDCGGAASFYTFDSTITLPTSVSQPFYSLLIRLVLDSNSVNFNCYIHDRIYDTLFFGVNAPLALPEIKDLPVFRVFPNPAFDKLSIILPINENGEYINIYNMQGTLIKNEKYKREVDISNIARGLYVIQIKTNNGYVRSRFIKQ